jgi:hypothetical protein
MTPVENLLRHIDSRWRERDPPAEKIRLSVIGASALLPQTQYQRGTKDSDILETAQLGELNEETVATARG